MRENRLEKEKVGVMVHGHFGVTKIMIYRGRFGVPKVTVYRGHFGVAEVPWQGRRSLAGDPAGGPWPAVLIELCATALSPRIISRWLLA